MASIASLDQFQAQSIWEMSDYSFFTFQFRVTIAANHPDFKLEAALQRLQIFQHGTFLVFAEGVGETVSRVALTLD